MTPAEATFELYWKGARYTFTSGQISYIGAEASTDYKNVYFAPAQSTTKVTNIHGAKITVAADYYLAVTDSSNLDNIKVSGFYPTVLLIKESSGTVKTVPMNDVTYSGENATFKNSITLTGTQGTTIGAQFVYDGQYYGWSDTNAPTILTDRVNAQSIKVTGQYSDSWLQLSPWITGGYTVSCVVTGTTNPTMTLSIECTSPTEYTRTVTSGNYGSICLPSAVASTAMTGIENIYSVSAVGTSSVTLTPVTTGMVAGTPYLFKSNASTVHFTFNGDRVDQPVSAPYLVGNFIAHNTYAGTHVPAGCYVLQTQDGVQAFRQVASGNTTFLSGRFRCYLNYTTPTSSPGDDSNSGSGENAKASVLNITFDDGSATAIDALNAVMNNEAVIYDLNGRRLPSLQKGINIVNGKKIIVK